MKEIRERIRKFKNSSLYVDWVEPLFVALILAIVIRTFVMQAFKIPSGSMRMTLVEGDMLLVNKLVFGPKVPLTDKRMWGYGDLQRGDVIVFIFPGDPKKDFIKRIIAKGGETVEIKRGDIYINGKQVEDPRIKNTYYYNRGDYGQVGQKVLVPEGHFYMMGDNSASSYDSRFWGFVPAKNVIGKAEFIYFPLDRIRLIK